MVAKSVAFLQATSYSPTTQLVLHNKYPTSFEFDRRICFEIYVHSKLILFSPSLLPRTHARLCEFVILLHKPRARRLTIKVQECWVHKRISRCHARDDEQHIYIYWTVLVASGNCRSLGYDKGPSGWGDFQMKNDEFGSLGLFPMEVVWFVGLYLGLQNSFEIHSCGLIPKNLKHIPSNVMLFFNENYKATPPFLSLLLSCDREVYGKQCCPLTRD